MRKCTGVVTDQSEGILLRVVLGDEWQHEVIEALHGRQMQCRQPRHCPCVDESLMGQQCIANLYREWEVSIEGEEEGRVVVEWFTALVQSLSPSQHLAI